MRVGGYPMWGGLPLFLAHQRAAVARCGATSMRGYHEVYKTG